MFDSRKMFATVAVDDVEKARQFYGQTLGLPVEDGDQPGIIQIKGDGRDPQFVIYPKPFHEPANFTVLNFPVDDVGSGRRRADGGRHPDGALRPGRHQDRQEGDHARRRHGHRLVPRPGRQHPLGGFGRQVLTWPIGHRLGSSTPRFSSPDAAPTPWSSARDQLRDAKVYWLSTVRPDSRPHVTTIAGLWLDDDFVFTTGRTERKARNLESNPACVVTTGSGALDGLDVVVEGSAVPVTDAVRLERIADAYNGKYGDLFGFAVRDGAMFGADTSDPALVFELGRDQGVRVREGRRLQPDPVSVLRTRP